MASSDTTGVRAVIINAGRLDFDRKLDLSKLSSVCGADANVTRHDDSTPSPSVIGERSADHTIVISKEAEPALH